MYAKNLLKRTVNLCETSKNWFSSNKNDEILEECARLENSFYEFIKAAWIHIDGRPFKDGWHVQAIAEHLEALYNLEIRNLIINCPPRVGKSSICSVLYPSWVWSNKPNLRFLYTSYSQSLSTRDSVATRRLIQSNWYQERWGNRFQLMADVNNKLKFDNNKNGYRICSSVDGANTGSGGDFQICDDPNNIRDIESSVIRESTNEWYDSVMPTRFCDFKTGRRLITQQRTHISDLSGHVLMKNTDWVHLSLPMEFEEDTRCITIPLKDDETPWIDPRTKEGELLWPEGIGPKELAALKDEFKHDSYRIAGQLQMRPSPKDGGILQKSWFNLWRENYLPEFKYIIQSWDTALTTSKMSCYSAATTWGVFEGDRGQRHLMLLSVFRGRLEYPELRKMAWRLAQNYDDTDIDDPYPRGYKNKPDIILIEAKVSGYTLFNDLFEAGLPVMKFDPGKYGDKVARCRHVSHLIENGLVWLQTESPGNYYLTESAQLFLDCAMLFPNTDANDLIDTMSQALIRLKQTGELINRFDPVFTNNGYKEDVKYW